MQGRKTHHKQNFAVRYRVLKFGLNTVGVKLLIVGYSFKTGTNRNKLAHFALILTHFIRFVICVKHHLKNVKRIG